MDGCICVCMYVCILLIEAVSVCSCCFIFMRIWVSCLPFFSDNFMILILVDERTEVKGPFCDY